MYQRQPVVMLKLAGPNLVFSWMQNRSAPASGERTYCGSLGDSKNNDLKATEHSHLITQLSRRKYNIIVKYVRSASMLPSEVGNFSSV